MIAGADEDMWFDWLLWGRHGGDETHARALFARIEEIRDRVLDAARLEPGQSVADIGCGDGLAGLAVLERFPTSLVTFVDISPALIARTHSTVERLGALNRARFLVSSAVSLDAIDDASIDVVVMRSVLAYIDEKRAAVRELRRILRRGGRISIVDPIFGDQAYALAGLAVALGRGECGSDQRVAELLYRWRSAQLPSSVEAIGRDSLTNYNERDLLQLFETSGFSLIHLRLHVDVVPALPIRWDAFLASSPRAGVPTVDQILATRFSPDERLEFEQLFRSTIEAGSTTERNVNAYIFADAGELSLT